MHHSFRDVIHVQRVEQQIAELVNEFSNWELATSISNLQYWRLG
jgi:hypothetical protein